MRVLIGIVCILAGLAVGAHGFSRVASNPPETSLEVATVRLPMRAAAPSPLPAVSSVVTLPKAPTATLPAPPVPVSATSQRPADGVSLVRELQQELKRVECYDGAINGLWTAPTRAAMRTFVEGVNAKLPIDKPDLVLLALLQGQQGPTCGSCPAGQAASGAGRCLPNAVVARATTKETPPLENASVALVSAEKPTAVVAERPRRSSRSAHRQPPIEGRMSVGAGSIAPTQLPERDVRLATAPPIPSGPQAAPPQRERRAARHGHRVGVAAFRSRAYLRSMRPTRYAFRPFRRPRGIAALFFGLF
jgi:hypothetical protein